MERTATIENIAHLRSDGFNWALRRYGSKNWYIYSGVPCLYRNEADVIAARDEFLA